MPIKNPHFVPPPGAKQDEYGNWYDPMTGRGYDDAVIAAPGEQAASSGTDSRGVRFFDSGSDSHGPAWAQHQRTYIAPQGHTYDQGGLFHKPESWNDKTGTYEQNFDWGTVFTMVTAGVLTLGMADALMGASAGTTEALMEGGTLADTGGAGVQAGLLGPSAETAADVAFADGTGGAAPGLLGPTAETTRDLADVGTGGNTPNGGGNGLSGLTTDQLIKLLGPTLAGLGEGLLQQHRQSFEGDASASNILGKATHGLDDLSGKLNAEKSAGVQLRAAPTGPSPTFTGGGLPMPIGLKSRGADPTQSLGTPTQTSDPSSITRRTSEGTRASTQPQDFEAMRASLKLLGNNYQVFG